MNLFLQIFIYIDVFIIGAASVTAVRHAYAHFRPHAEAKDNRPPPTQPNLSKEVRDKLILDAETKYQAILDRSAGQLSKELGITMDKINQSINHLASDIIDMEQKGFASLFKEYEDKASATLDSAKDQSLSYQNELKAKLEADAEAEKQRLISLIDNKLSDAVLSFLAEAMQHEVDLGAQTDYLMHLLEKHKDEFKQALN